MNARVLEFAGLYLSERGRLQRLIRRIVGNQAVAEDLVQDTFVKLSDRTIPVEPGLLLRTGQNLALDHLRAQQVRNRYARAGIHPQHVQAEAQPDQALAARQELQAFLAALRALPLEGSGDETA